MYEIFPALVYVLCFATSALCSYMLFRSYSRSKSRLLLWSAICFVLLAANNLVVIIDMLVLRDVDFSLIRIGLSLAAVAILLFGFVWDLEDDRGD